MTAVEVKPRPVDSRQLNPTTQTFPVLGRVVPECLVWEKLGPNNIPGNPWRAVPNYNGYQPDASGNLIYTEPNYLDPDKPFVTIPPEYGANHRKGCMYDTGICPCCRPPAERWHGLVRLLVPQSEHAFHSLRDQPCGALARGGR